MNPGTDTPHPKSCECTEQTADGSCGKPAITFCRNVVEYPNHRSGFMEAVVGRRRYAGCVDHPVKTVTYRADSMGDAERLADRV